MRKWETDWQSARWGRDPRGVSRTSIALSIADNMYPLTCSIELGVKICQLVSLSAGVNYDACLRPFALLHCIMFALLHCPDKENSITRKLDSVNMQQCNNPSFVEFHSALSRYHVDFRIVALLGCRCRKRPLWLIVALSIKFGVYSSWTNVGVDYTSWSSDNRQLNCPNHGFTSQTSFDVITSKQA